MNLHVKTAVIITLIVCGLTGVLYFSSTRVFIERFLDIEEEETQERVLQVQDAIQYELSRIDGMVREYGFRDATCRFIDDPGEDYIRNNITDAFFINQSINVLLITSTNGRIVYAYEDVMGGGTRCDLSSLPPLYRKRPVHIVPHVLRLDSLRLFQTFFGNPHNTYWNGSLLAEYTLSQLEPITQPGDLS